MNAYYRNEITCSIEAALWNRKVTSGKHVGGPATAKKIIAALEVQPDQQLFVTLYEFNTIIAEMEKANLVENVGRKGWKIVR